MRNLFRSLAVLMMTLTLGACASSRMVDLPQPPKAISAPESGKATVVFLRPSYFGGAIQSSVFDIGAGATQLVGIVSAGRKIAYAVSPGPRRFMVVGESADFVDADLTAGKTYYARVEALWKARFSLTPVQADDASLTADLAACSWVENSPESIRWAQDNFGSIEAKRTSYLMDWEKEANKPVLAPWGGR
ncbi:conserved exported hypothetical protein [Candidatus Terasakiella magnetica]|nr:conserved exported hypothetical protein [Candidatus Terasakiella magnetica]